jgi:putative glutamine amidotransferase
MQSQSDDHKMTFIGITQRVDLIPEYGERRDALDQNWNQFLSKCGLTPILLPNKLFLVKQLLSKIPINGIILSGGNSHQSLGGNAPERDEVDSYLIDHCIKNNLPMIGVCRGMQMLQLFHSQKLQEIDGHICDSQTIIVNGKEQQVNSYHNWGSKQVDDPLTAFAYSQDGIIKAISHQTLPLFGIMWHPERFAQFRTYDVQFFKDTFIK